MSEYDQYVHGPGTATAAKPAAANEYDQYVKQTGTAPLQGAPGFGSGGFGAVQKTVDRAGKNATKTVGRALVQGHKDPVGSFLGLVQAPQRGLQSLETNNETDEGKRLGAAWSAMKNPRTAKSLAQKTKDQIGLGALERGPLAGNDLPRKLVRGALDIGLDTVNDPVTYAPGPDLLKIPGVKQGLTKLSESAIGKGASKLLNPDHKLRGLTPDAKAEYDVVSNRAKEAARTKREADAAIIKKHADAIRSGEMPDEVARLFDPKTATILPKQVRPGAPSSALNRAAAPVEAPISQLESKFTDKINQRPSAVARGAQVTQKVESPGGSIRPGSTTSKDVSRGAKVTPRDVPRELAPTIRPGAPREALNARPAAASAAAPAGTLKNRFTDTMSRSNAGQSTSDAWKSHFLDDAGKLEFGPGTRPQDVARKLSASRAPALQDEIEKGLRDKGFFETPESIRAGQSMGKPGMFSAPVDEIPSVQKRLLDNLAPKPENKNAIIQGAKALTHRGNQAFLANPIPHVGNLANLAYNKYGAPTALKGLLLNAPRVAMGKTGGRLGENINELESLGAKSQYGNIFDEMGLTRIAGIPGTEGAARVANKALVPLQRASNAAQHKILNSAETGLRSAALDAERAGGATGARAAKNIHATFGTDAPNALTQGAQDLAAPFFKFHGQTAPGSVLNTLARNPARITNTVKANQDYNAQVNPHGPKYHSTVPGANAARMLMDPMGYFGSLGPISELKSPFGLIEQLKKKGGLEKVLSENAGRFTPGSQEITALAELLKHKKNPQSKASGVQDLSSTLFGGYYGK